MVIQIRGSNGDVRCRRALCELKVRASKAANTGMHVPSDSLAVCPRIEGDEVIHSHSRWLTRRRRQIVLEQDCTPLLALSRNDHITPLNCTLLTRLADLHDWLRTVEVIEIVAMRQNDRVRLANNLGTCRNIDGLRNQIIAMIDKENLA